MLVQSKNFLSSCPEALRMMGTINAREVYRNEFPPLNLLLFEVFLDTLSFLT